MRGISGRKDTAVDPSFAHLVERSGYLKQELVQFAQSARFRRWLTPALLAVAGTDGTIDEADAMRAVDAFALGECLPDGTAVLDIFLRQRRDLPEDEREMMLGWRDPVDGIFEIKHKHKDSLVLLNLVDDLEYRTYSNLGPSVFRPVRAGDFVTGRVVPVLDAWIVSGALEGYSRASAREVAQTALDLAARNPRLIMRNPAKAEEAWAAMRHNRQDFIEFFGSDEVILPPAEAQERINEHLQSIASRQLSALTLPEEFYDHRTVGIIFDEVDGMNVYADYGMLRDLFADPARAADRAYADALRGYLKSDTIAPLPLCRLAAAYPETVDEVFRKVLRQSHFSWDEHGEALLRRRKAWYYEREPYPGVTLIGTRVRELLDA